MRLLLALTLTLIACGAPVPPADCSAAPQYNGEPCCESQVGARCFGTQAWACEPEGLSDGGYTFTWYINGAQPVSASCRSAP